MLPPPNGMYTAFSFIGFVLCAIPFYWHLEAWNTGTCLYMAWVGLGCLMQCINSIVWDKNTVNRAPVYCDISTRIQIGLNVAVPACSLCINRRLYKIATMKTVVFSKSEKRRAVIYDSLIGIGIPILQMLAQYIVSPNRYDIIEDFGPYPTMVFTPLTFVFFFAWPVAIGIVSLFYCATNIYMFYKRKRQFRQLMLSLPGCSRARYIRLMVISTKEILGSTPVRIFYTVYNSRLGVTPWRGWAYTHQNYSKVYKIPASSWKNAPNIAFALEMSRWTIVLGAFIFFALFGFAQEARQNYRRIYTSMANRIGYSTSTHFKSQNAIPSVPNVKSNDSLTVSVVTTIGDTPRLSLSFSDRPFVESVYDDLSPDFRTKYSRFSVIIFPSVDTVDEPESGAIEEGQSAQLAGTMPKIPSPTVLPHPSLPDMTKSTFRQSSGFHTV